MLPGYDAWKTTDPADNRCEYCGIDLYSHGGWQPEECTGECGLAWRDPDQEYEDKRDA